MTTMPDEEITEELLEDSEYSRKSDFSKAIIVQTQISRCLEHASKDMRPGYTTWIMDKDGSAKPVVVPDSRKEYVASVEALMNLLAPEINLKKPGLLSDYETTKEEYFTEFAYRERISRKIVDGKPKWEYGDRIFMPHKGQPLMDFDPQYPNRASITMNPHLWDSKIDAYWDSLVDLASQLFRELNKLIHDIDYFKGAMGM